ncbi:hypothetical protein [Bauldia litoralis]|uniref:hypothetical protein n=1 Tax=Bauldia litoralis TaxID=665467 RepID=UPI003266B946
MNQMTIKIDRMPERPKLDALDACVSLQSEVVDGPCRRRGPSIELTAASRVKFIAEIITVTVSPNIAKAKHRAASMISDGYELMFGGQELVKHYPPKRLFRSSVSFIPGCADEASI